MRGDYSGWMRNNPWEPWCRVIYQAAEPGDAIHAMESIFWDAVKRGCMPSRVALPLNMVPDCGHQKACDEVFEDGNYE